MLDARLGMGAVSLRVADLGRSEEFYTTKLGLAVIDRAPGVLLLGVESRILLRLVEVPGATAKPRRSTGLYHFAILVPTRRDLGIVLAHLVRSGTRLQGGADHLVSEALYLADPDGNGIEIYRDRTREEWPWEGDQVAMENAPLDIDGLIRESEGEELETLARGTKMGHVHLQVRDLDEAESFYQGVIGFNVMQRWRPSALFVSAGGYHHRLGLNTWSGVGAPPPPENAVGLEYYTIELPPDELAEVRSRLEQAGVVVSEEGGAVRLKDPSGNGMLLVAL